MKKRMITVLLIVVFVYSLNSVFAASLDVKQDFDKKETMIGKINGIINEPIQKQDIKFLRNSHISVPVEYDIKRLGDEWYFWAILDLQPGNYTLLIKVKTMENNQNTEVELSKEIIISNNTNTSYYVKPGAIYTDKNFEIEVYLDSDLKQNVSVSFQGTKSVELSPGKNTIMIDINKVNSTRLYNLALGKYNIPVFVLKNESVVEKEYEFYFAPAFIREFRLYSSSNRVLNFTINNNKDGIVGAKFEYNNNSYIISPDRNITIKSGENLSFNISLIGNESIKDNIYLRFGEYEKYMPFEINFTNNLTEVIIKNGSNGSILNRCFELGGKICSANLICSVDLIASVDGSCCVGVCKTEESGGKGWIGFLIIGIVILIVGIVFLRYKKIGLGSNPLVDRLKQIGKKN